MIQRHVRGLPYLARRCTLVLSANLVLGAGAALRKGSLRQRASVIRVSPDVPGAVAAGPETCFGRPAFSGDLFAASDPCAGSSAELNASWSRDAAGARKRQLVSRANASGAARGAGLVNASGFAEANSTATQVPQAAGPQHPRNLCMDVGWGPGVAPDEHLAPEFILLGAQKAATSSFAFMFYTEGVMYSHVFHGEPGCVWKEAHIFDNYNKRFELGKGFWLYHYPRCSYAAGKRMVAADFTPSYLTDSAAPARMREYYGERASQITFAVILRDPLARMHSAFHFYQNQNWCEQKHLDGGFEKYVNGVLQGNDPCKLLIDGNYTEQLQRYFGVFTPAQFNIIPFKEIVSPRDGSATVISALWQKLGLKGGAAPRVQYVHVNRHPALEKELGASTLAAIRAHIADTMGSNHVARLVTRGGSRPTLLGYAGDGGDPNSVAAWLTASW